MKLLDSPLSAKTLADFGVDFRSGAVTAVETAHAMLARIDALEPGLRAFTHLDSQRALIQAEAIDKLWGSRVDLGPLMGVPVAVKDIFSVDGTPTRAGSRVQVEDLVAPQGHFITSLLQAGCVLLGKTTTTEFCLGGFNLTHPLPRNPCDSEVPRMTGGSSHGSAVAMAASLAGFTVGGDTGGSVRWPAALCGVTGFKFTADRWELDGIFPLSPQMDSIGIFTADAHDAAFVEAALRRGPMRNPPQPHAITLALPRDHFMENLDTEVAECFAEAVARLRKAGVRIIEVPMPEAAEIDAVFAGLVPAELLAFLGRERLGRQWDLLDPVAASRIEQAFEMRADEYVRLTARKKVLEKLVARRLAGIDALISPTVPMVPRPTAEFSTVEQVSAWNRLATQNTRPANLFNQCGISLPVHHLGSALPVGLQLCGAAGSDDLLLAAARTVQDLLGIP